MFSFGVYSNISQQKSLAQQQKLYICLMPMISGVGLFRYDKFKEIPNEFCYDKFDKTPNEKMVNMSKLTKPYFDYNYLISVMYS